MTDKAANQTAEAMPEPIYVSDKDYKFKNGRYPSLYELTDHILSVVQKCYLSTPKDNTLADALRELQNRCKNIGESKFPSRAHFDAYVDAHLKATEVLAAHDAGTAGESQ